MKKRYGLDNIIGKRSKLRYPSHISSPKTHLLYFIIPANDAISEPPLNTNITMRKGDPLEFCDQFNEESYDFEEGLPLNVIIYISPSEQLFDIKAPTVTSLLGIVFDLEDMPFTDVDTSLKTLFIAAINFSLIHLNPMEDFFLSDLINKVPSLYGSLFSFNRKMLYPRQSKRLIKTRRPKRYLNNSSHILRKRNKRLHKLKKYIKTIEEYPDLHLLPFFISRFYTSLELLNVWQEEDDLIWANEDSNFIAEVLDYFVIVFGSLCLEYNLELNNKIKQDILQMDLTMQMLQTTVNTISGPSKISLDFYDKLFSSYGAIHYDSQSVFEEDYGLSITYYSNKNQEEEEEEDEEEEKD
jgi:hypothetical protein